MGNELSYYIRRKAVTKILDYAKDHRVDKVDIVRIGVNEGLSSRSSVKLLQDLVFAGLLREEGGHWYRTEKKEEG